MKFTFSGHESFQCKSLWLKKGYDYAKTGKSFNDEDAVVELGVGKNMVSSIRFWLRAFGIISEDGKVTTIGDYIFADNEGCDPYLEDTATLWLLHYLLVKTGYATTYNIVFTDFIKTRKDFSKTILLNYFKRLFADKRFEKTPYNENTMVRDIATLIKNYSQPDNAKVCDDFSAALIDLNLIKRIDKEIYEFNGTTKCRIEPLIFLYTIVDVAKGENVVEFSKLLFLANIFGMSMNELYDIFEEIHKQIPSVSFNNTAGEQLFTIGETITKEQVLDMYYKSI